MGSPRQDAFLDAVEALYDKAARSHQTSRALSEIMPVFFEPDIEARVWCDHAGEVLLIADVIKRVLGEERFRLIASVAGERVDKAANTFTLELSNGSAIVLGYKSTRHKYADDNECCRASPNDGHLVGCRNWMVR